jgi:hypothetical protein
MSMSYAYRYASFLSIRSYNYPQSTQAAYAILRDPLPTRAYASSTVVLAPVELPCPSTLFFSSTSSSAPDALPSRPRTAIPCSRLGSWNEGDASCVILDVDSGASSGMMRLSMTATIPAMRSVRQRGLDEGEGTGAVLNVEGRGQQVQGMP